MPFYPLGSEMLIQLPASCKEHFYQSFPFELTFWECSGTVLLQITYRWTVIHYSCQFMYFLSEPLKSLLFSIDWPCYPKGNVEQSSGDPFFFFFLILQNKLEIMLKMKSQIILGRGKYNFFIYAFFINVLYCIECLVYWYFLL